MKTSKHAHLLIAVAPAICVLTLSLISRSANYPHAASRHVGSLPTEASSERSARTSEELRDEFERGFETQQPALEPNPALQGLARLTAILPAGSQVHSFECRSNSCRIVTSHASMMQYQAFLEAAFLDSKTRVWNAGWFTTRLEPDALDGRMKIVSFLAREGRQLPAIPSSTGQSH